MPDLQRFPQNVYQKLKDDSSSSLNLISTNTPLFFESLEISSITYNFLTYKQTMD